MNDVHLMCVKCGEEYECKPTEMPVRCEECGGEIDFHPEHEYESLEDKETKSDKI